MQSTSPFGLDECKPIPNLDLEMQRYRHPSGATHVHLACDDPHRAFVIAFRTQVDTHTGLPHILEHTTLCGSERFPVRDPFFMMLRRSLQTFMNAFTYTDRTAYPFATQIAQDFDNLLEVYLDAVFAPRLDPLDFCQEGWRLEPTGDDWSLKGVVFNEMKGAMGSTEAQMGDALCRHLLPATCYAFNSGGDPAHIPDLSYADLVAFHQRCYGAANACIATYGDVNLADLHGRLDAYCRLHPGTPQPIPALQPPLLAPLAIDVPVPHETGQDERDVTAATWTAAWGDTADVDDNLLGQLLDHLCFGHPGSPLRLALERSGLGRSIAGSGFSADCRNSLFTVEMTGVRQEDYGAFTKLVSITIEETARHGFHPDTVAAALDQLELRHRYIGGDGLPFGLQLCLRCLSAWNFGRPVDETLDQTAALGELRQRLRDPTSLGSLLTERLLDNPHRILLSARPDPTFHARWLQNEQALVTRRVSELDAVARDGLATQATALTIRQASQDDPEVLPRLPREAIPSQRPFPDLEEVHGCICGRTRTNGVAFQTVAIPLDGPGATTVELVVLARCLGQLGLEDLDYVALSETIDRICGDVGASLVLGYDAEDAAAFHPFLSLSAHGLEDRFADFADLIPRILRGTRFDEWRRLKELHAESLDALQGTLRGSGHRMAVMAALRGAPGATGGRHDRSGIGRLLDLRQAMEERGDDREAWLALGRTLADRLATIAHRSASLLLIGSGDPAILARRQREVWSGPTSSAVPPPVTLPGTGCHPSTAFVTATGVNYNALVLPAVPMAHPDAGPLAVAGHLLSQRFLHPAIRERGGAYGAFASYNPASAHLELATYRDPRLDGSLDDFAAGCTWLADWADTPTALDEAVLGVIARFDAPGSPAGEVRRMFEATSCGRSPAMLNAFRQRVLAVDAAVIREVAQRYCRPECGRIAAVVSREALQASTRDWQVVEV